jgi:hypothetical protein
VSCRVWFFGRAEAAGYGGEQINKYLTLRMAVVVGGDTLEAQFDQLATNPDIIIATPGRLMHHLQVMQPLSPSPLAHYSA